MADYDVSTKSKKFGYGWTNSPTQTETGLTVFPPSKPDTTGTFNQCSQEESEAEKLNKTNYWAGQWFYDGKPIIAVWDEGAPVYGNRWEVISGGNVRYFDHEPSYLELDDPGAWVQREIIDVRAGWAKGNCPVFNDKGVGKVRTA